MTVELIEGDCLEVMPTLKAGSIDLILTDLPYGVTANPWDEVIPFAPMWREFWRLCPSGVVVLTAAQPFSSALVMSQPRAFRYEWVWEKNKATGHLQAKKQPMKAHELVLVFSLKAPPYYPQMVEGAPYKARPGKKNGTNYGTFKAEREDNTGVRYPRDVVSFPVVQRPVHPTQKPVELMEYLVATYSRAGQTVLTATAGSGTVALAARNLGRNCVAIERDPEYFDIACERLGL